MYRYCNKELEYGILSIGNQNVSQIRYTNVFIYDANI